MAVVAGFIMANDLNKTKHGVQQHQGRRVEESRDSTREATKSDLPWQEVVGW